MVLRPKGTSHKSGSDRCSASPLPHVPGPCAQRGVPRDTSCPTRLVWRSPETPACPSRCNDFFLADFAHISEVNLRKRERRGSRIEDGEQTRVRPCSSWVSSASINEENFDWSWSFILAKKWLSFEGLRPWSLDFLEGSVNEPSQLRVEKDTRFASTGWSFVLAKKWV